MEQNHIYIDKKRKNIYTFNYAHSFLHLYMYIYDWICFFFLWDSWRQIMWA